MARPTVILYPGAGSAADHSSLVLTEERIGRTADVRRRDFPYRREGRRAPDRAPKLMASIRTDLSEVSRRRGPLVLGGRSMGGRMTSMVAANVDEQGPVARLRGLVLIAYPLHPPGKPEKLRVEHLGAIDVPCLFISGTKDTFGTPAELEHWTAQIPAPVEHIWVEGKGHDLRRSDELIADAVAEFVSRLSDG